MASFAGVSSFFNFKLGLEPVDEGVSGGGLPAAAAGAPPSWGAGTTVVCPAFGAGIAFSLTVALAAAFSVGSFWPGVFGRIFRVFESGVETGAAAGAGAAACGAGAAGAGAAA